MFLSEFTSLSIFAFFGCANQGPTAFVYIENRQVGLKVAGVLG